MSALDRWWRFREQALSQGWNLGLDRVARVVSSEALYPDVPVITVAGTNGKGSVCRFIDAFARAAGWRTGVYTSPHLLRFNERIRIDGKDIEDGALASAFAKIAAAPQVNELSVYEFDTLSAMRAFMDADPDLIVLEVGLGGRLDAVNVWDADVAVITPVSLDHQQWLGETRELIGCEKAGIMRRARPVVIAEPEPPASVLARAHELGCIVRHPGRDHPAWSSGREVPGFQRENAAAALAALQALPGFVIPDEVALGNAFTHTRHPGRCERIEGDVPVWLDVGHNEQAVAMLAGSVRARPVEGRSLAVFAALSDKAIEKLLAPLVGLIDHWYLPQLDDPRACTDHEQVARVRAAGALAQDISSCDNVATAFQQARSAARRGDQLIVFGSFLTVAGVMAADGCINP